MNLILFSVTTFAVLDYFYRFMRFVSTDLAKIAKFLCFYSKSGLNCHLRYLLDLYQQDIPEDLRPDNQLQLSLP